MTTKEEVMKDMEEMIQQAEREGKWLRANYNGMVFTPSELRLAHTQNKFLWGKINFYLVVPEDVLKESLNRLKVEQNYYQLLVNKLKV